jgi:ElaB/YqjD/DUF883 family membrane-anchored ribosome-binding protein
VKDLKSILGQAEALLRQATRLTGVQAQELRDKVMVLLEQVKD